MTLEESLEKIRPQERAEFDAWFAERPLCVQERIRSHPPCNVYRMASTGQCARILAYETDDADTECTTVHVQVWREDFPAGMEIFMTREVFDVAIADLAFLKDMELAQ